MWRTPTNRLSLLLVPLLALAGCTRKESDEARLKKLIDTLPVHVYVGARAAIADTSDSRQLKVLRQRLIRIVVSGQTRDGKQEDLSLSELGGVARQVVRLRRRGAQMVREGKDSPPILPVVLGQQRFGPGYDANTEHCITLAGMFVAKFHPRSPVPVPEELLLYEAARADPTRKPVATGAMPLHAIRAVIFARNALCDLAQREASAAFDAPNTKRLRALLTDIGQTTITDAQLTSLAAGLEALAHGAVALCQLRRDEPLKAHGSLARMLGASQKAGVRAAELDYLRAYLECSESKDRAKRGLTRLAALSSRKDLPGYLRGDLHPLKQYCTTAAGTSSNLLRKVAFSRMTIRLAMTHVEAAGVTDAVGKNDAYRVVGRLGAMIRLLGGGGDRRVKDRARGLLKKLRP